MDAHPVPVLTSWESAGSDLTLGEPQSPSQGQWLPLNVTSAWDSIQTTSQVENNSKTNAPQQFHSQPTLGMTMRGTVSYCLLLLLLLPQDKPRAPKLRRPCLLQPWGPVSVSKKGEDDEIGLLWLGLRVGETVVNMSRQHSGLYQYSVCEGPAPVLRARLTVYPAAPPKHPGLGFSFF